ncbi:hypothetical protein DB771_11345 [Burkholderia sp. AU29985]|nr:hypothetical protein EGY28_29190 [Burkholderia dolosa]PRE55359.1 hypothetical protein C6P87_04290 [Burkholderia sp. AU12872]PUA76768.1 hypothetical protein DB771_11345 [Burkholderia sp. AU29985]
MHRVHRAGRAIRASSAAVRLADRRHRLAGAASGFRGHGRAAQHRWPPPALPCRAARVGTIAALRRLHRIAARHPDCRRHSPLQ